MANSMKDEIKTFYGGIAKQVSETSKGSCCSGGSCCCDCGTDSNLYSAEYIADLPVEAINASLGCANPVALANLQKGEIVLDLGSGGGIDVLISAKFVGDSGKAYGLDMTDEMLELANRNKEKSGATNVEFIKGYIEDIPLPDEVVDVITSNCVINLSESKESALKEAYRVLKKGGRLAIADIVEMKDVPDDIRQSVQLWVGCISGALSISDYERILKEVGFTGIEITPVNIYTKDMIKNIAEAENLNDLYAKLDENAVDGAFAGAHVKAYK
ncbi:arsenite methyltransferase [Lachnoclostridium sp.]|uniref:arsenite methyltransferase n=1 Tax=Lachnoclostridium sp. TaxID=2028282 RepID=UPI0028A12242|nr:arsenite methyltransferase [Lachnoclostridium sp.]